MASDEDVTTIIELIDEVHDREQMRRIFLAAQQGNVRIFQAEEAKREADPEYQQRQRESRERLDADLAAEEDAFQQRRAERNRELEEAPVVGTIVLKAIRPKYLIGKRLPVIGVLEKTYKCNVPDEPEFKTWRGRKGIRVPKGSADFEAVQP